MTTRRACVLRLMDDRHEPPAAVLASASFCLDAVAASSVVVRELCDDLRDGVMPASCSPRPANYANEGGAAEEDGALVVDVPFGRKMEALLALYVFTDRGEQSHFVVPEMAEAVARVLLPAWYGGRGIRQGVHPIYRMPRQSAALLVVADFLDDAALSRAVVDDMLCTGEAHCCPLEAYRVADAVYRVVGAREVLDAMYAALTRRGWLLSMVVGPRVGDAPLQFDTTRCPFVRHALPATRADAQELLRELRYAAVLPDVFVPSAERVARRIFGDQDDDPPGGVSDFGSVEDVVERALESGRFLVLHRLKSAEDGSGRFASLYSVAVRGAGGSLRVADVDVDGDLLDGANCADAETAVNSVHAMTAGTPWFAYDFDADTGAPVMLAADWDDWGPLPAITARLAAMCPAHVREAGEALQAMLEH